MFSLSPDSESYSGFVQGLPQNSIRFQIRLASRDLPAPEQWLSYLYRASGMHDASPDSVCSAEGEPVSALIRWCLQFHLEHRVTVCDQFHITPGASDDACSVLLPQAIPYTLLRDLMAWAADTINIACREPQAPEGSSAERISLENRLQAISNAMQAYRSRGVNTFHILRAAYASDIPVSILFDSIISLGTGARSHWLQSLMSEATSAISSNTARNKMFTKALLRSHGLPVAEGKIISGLDELHSFSKQAGFPVVVKPVDGDQGLGVTAHILEESEFDEALKNARAVSVNIMAEKHVSGFTYRFAIVNGEIVKIVKRIAGGVTGDGLHTIAELVEKRHAEAEARRFARRLGKQILEIDNEARAFLARQQLDVDSIPDPGRYVRLRARDNRSSGGTNEIVPASDVHEDNLALAIQAVNLLRLDIAGVDMISPDIAGSWHDNGTVICELNCQPQMGVSGTPDIYQQLLHTLIGDQSRVPAGLVLLADDTRVVPGQMARIAQQRGYAMFSCCAGVFHGSRKGSEAFPNGFFAARALLNDRSCESALCFVSLRDAQKFGFPLDRFDEYLLVNDGQHSAREEKLLREVLQGQGLRQENLEQIQG